MTDHGPDVSHAGGTVIGILRDDADSLIFGELAHLLALRLIARHIEVWFPWKPIAQPVLVTDSDLPAALSLERSLRRVVVGVRAAIDREYVATLLGPLDECIE